MSVGLSRHPERKGRFRDAPWYAQSPTARVAAAIVTASTCLLLLASCGGDTGTEPSRVKGPPPPPIIVLDGLDDSVEIDMTRALQASCVDSLGVVINDCPIAWVSADTTIATVAQDGTVTGVAVGSTQLTASSGKASASLRLTVTPPAVVSIIFPATQFSVTEGDSLQLPTPTLIDRNGAIVTDRTPRYESNTGGATVSQSGMVHARVAGIAPILVKLDSAFATLIVTIDQAPVAAVKVMPTLLDMGVGHSVGTYSTAYAEDGSQLFRRLYTYQIADPAIATVNSTGIVRGLSPGKTTLTVRTGAGSLDIPVSVAQLAIGGYKIDIRFAGNVSTEVRQAAAAAAEAWETIISAPLTPYRVITNANDCGAGTPAVNATVTSLMVIVQEDSVDGPANTIGLGGPCVIRDDQPQLPALGTLTIDHADVASLAARKILVGTITHEIGHILGIGTLWSDDSGFGATPPFAGLVAGLGGVDPVFTGSQARAASAALGFTTDPSLGVPIENVGDVGDGTRDAHWRASVFGHELMTGTIHLGLNPISLVTIDALADFGYTVVPEAAADFNVFNADNPSAPINPSRSIGIKVRETILFPQFTTSRGGTLTPIPGARQPEKQ